MRRIVSVIVLMTVAAIPAPAAADQPLAQCDGTAPAVVLDDWVPIYPGSGCVDYFHWEETNVVQLQIGVDPTFTGTVWAKVEGAAGWSVQASFRLGMLIDGATSSIFTLPQGESSSSYLWIRAGCPRQPRFCIGQDWAVGSFWGSLSIVSST